MSAGLSIAESARAGELFGDAPRGFSVRVVVDGVPRQFSRVDAATKAQAVMVALQASGLSVLDFTRITITADEV